LFQQFTKLRGRLVAIQPTGGHIEHKRFPIVHRQLQVWKELVDFQENQARRECGSLVPVDEGVIPAKVEKIRCRDLDWIGY
jgi:hypothetical protein